SRPAAVSDAMRVFLRALLVVPCCVSFSCRSTEDRAAAQTASAALSAELTAPLTPEEQVPSARRAALPASSSHGAQKGSSSENHSSSPKPKPQAAIIYITIPEALAPLERQAKYVDPLDRLLAKE